MAEKDVHAESGGVFSCPRCWQKYDTRETTIVAILKHMEDTHGEAHGYGWVHRRTKEAK